MADLTLRHDIVKSMKSIQFDAQFVVGSRQVELMGWRKLYDGFMNGYVDNLVVDIDSWKSHLCFCAEAVHGVLYCEHVSFNKKWFNMISKFTGGLMTVIEKFVMLRYNSSVKPKIRGELNEAVNVLSHFTMLLSLLWISKSKFRHHQLLWHRLLHFPRLSQRGSHDMSSANVVYMWWSPCSLMSYIGETTCGFNTRCQQHRRYMSLPDKYKRNQLPFYKAARGIGTYKFVAMPLLTLSCSCKTEIKFVEHQLHLRWMPRGDAPWVHKYVGVKADSDIVQASQKECAAKRVCYGKRRLLHKVRNVDLMFASDLGVKTDLACINDFTLCKFGKYAPFLTSVKLLDRRRKGVKGVLATRALQKCDPEGFAKVLKNVYSFARDGISRRIGLLRLDQGKFSDVVVIPFLVLPGVRVVEHVRAMFREVIAGCLKPGRCAMLKFKEQSAPSIAEYMSNTKEMGRIADKVDLPCTCKELKKILKFDAQFPRVDAGLCDRHVCERAHLTAFNETVPIGVSATTRIVWSAKECKKVLKCAVEKVIDKLRKHFVSSPSVLIAEFAKWVDCKFEEHGNFQNCSVRQDHLEQWRQQLTHTGKAKIGRAHV